MSTKLVRVEFEVFGTVQGVFFRKFTQKKCLELDLKGWCRNTSTNTVKGVLEGEVDKVQVMKKWLQEEGSPKSKIIKTVFSDAEPIDRYSFNTFEIRR
ncbi:acylphosphatase-1-like [Planococcus citri]|uniref:acylphosphatase-1-like n=1 Tax=Planococcus citri TaxID=170843 RepID=UPI0031F917CA